MKSGSPLLPDIPLFPCFLAVVSSIWLVCLVSAGVIFLSGILFLTFILLVAGHEGAAALSKGLHARVTGLGREIWNCRVRAPLERIM